MSGARGRYFFNIMTIKVGKRYRTRGGLVAKVTSDDSSLYIGHYPMLGKIIRKGYAVGMLAYWTRSGSYILEHLSQYDLVEEIC